MGKCYSFMCQKPQTWLESSVSVSLTCVVYQLRTSQAQSPELPLEGHTHLIISTFSPPWQTMDRMCFSWPLLCVSASRFLHPLSSTVNWLVCVQSQMEPWTWILLPSHCSFKDVLVPKSGRCRVGLDAIKDACLSKILCFHVVTPATFSGTWICWLFPISPTSSVRPPPPDPFFLPTDMFQSLLFQSPRAQIQKRGQDRSHKNILLNCEVASVLPF